MGVHVLRVCLVGVAIYLIGRLIRRRGHPLPPGPPGWPLIGNLFDVPMHAPYKIWGAMSQKYGPIIHFNLLGTRYVVINSPKVAKELLEKRSAITSNRPHPTMGCDLVGMGDATIFLQYGDTYRKHRKFFHQQIGTKSSLEVFYPAEEEEAKQFVRGLLQNPDDLIAQCRRTAGAVILKISHGYTVKRSNDPFLDMTHKTIDGISSAMDPGRFLVDMIPILKYLPEWFPGGGFHKEARRLRNMVNETASTPYKFVLDRLSKGDAAPSFISRALQEGVTPEEEDVLKWASFSMYLGGSDSTQSILIAFFLAMTIYPDVLKRAQTEIDAVVGQDRLPTCQDRDALPYVNAICFELLRWHVTGAFMVHASTQDTIFNGYLIPKGTFLIANIWFMLSDPETYPNPEVFDPERFLGENQQMNPREVGFGWGRRLCPGIHLAELTIFTCVAMAVATLNVSRCFENGMECIPKYEAEEKITRHVKPFKCGIAPRSTKVEDLLRNL